MNATGSGERLPPPAPSSLPYGTPSGRRKMGFPRPRSRAIRRSLVLSMIVGYVVIVVAIATASSPGRFDGALGIIGGVLAISGIAGLFMWFLFASASDALDDDLRAWRDQIAVPTWPVIVFYLIVIGASFAPGSPQFIAGLTLLIFPAIGMLLRGMVYAWMLPDPRAGGSGVRPAVDADRWRAAMPSTFWRRTFIAAGLTAYVVLSASGLPWRAALGSIADVMIRIALTVGTAVSLWLAPWCDHAERKRAAIPRPLYAVFDPPRQTPGPWILTGLASAAWVTMIIVSLRDRATLSIDFALTALVVALLPGIGAAWRGNEESGRRANGVGIDVGA